MSYTLKPGLFYPYQGVFLCFHFPCSAKSSCAVLFLKFPGGPLIVFCFLQNHRLLEFLDVGEREVCPGKGLEGPKDQGTFVEVLAWQMEFPS